MENFDALKNTLHEMLIQAFIEGAQTDGNAEDYADKIVGKVTPFDKKAPQYTEFERWNYAMQNHNTYKGTEFANHIFQAHALADEDNALKLEEMYPMLFNTKLHLKLH